MERMERAGGLTGAATGDPLAGPMVKWAWALQNSYATYFEVTNPLSVVHCYATWFDV